MAIWNLGSINIDRFYRVPHLPAPGETLAATDYSEGLGGKGANMSVAIARAGARVCHVGAVGAEGAWARDRLLEYGVDTCYIDTVSVATGHANINVSADGENQIILHAGANASIGEALVSRALSEAATSDTLVMQNETNGQAEAAALARQLGLKVAYAAAPFDEAAVRRVLPFTDLLFLNAVEAGQLQKATGACIETLPIAHAIVTRGGDGATWFDISSGTARDIPAYPARVLDTTGAGDTFTGFALAGLDRGMNMEQALHLASRAAALMVARHGTADVIPDLKDVEDARFG